MPAENFGVPAKLPTVALLAVIIAFLVGALGLATAVVHLSYLPASLLFVAAGVAILRRRTWGGYGFALVVLTQALLIPVLVRGNSIPASQMSLTALFGVAFVLLFFLAGRALSRVGAKAGARWPWIGLALVLSVPFLFVRAYAMPSGSMENTLLSGDRMLVRVVPRPIPKRGDLLVFHYPLDPKQIFIKRVIGVGGDRVRMINRAIYLNGAALSESYVIHRFPYDPHRDNLPGGSDDRGLESVPGLLAAKTEMLQHHVVNDEVIVPAGKYFVLGDNRDNSLDSRYWGFVNESEIIGKPMLIYESQAETATEPGLDRAKGTHTRWDRVFKLL